MNNNTYPVLSYIGPNTPTTNTMWVNGTIQNIGSPNNNIPIGYQQQGHIVYPISVLPGSPILASPTNVNSPTQSFMWGSGGAVLVQASTNPVILSTPLVVNPQFVHHIPGEQLVTQTTGIGSSVTSSASNSDSQNQVLFSATQVNYGLEQQQRRLQQEQEEIAEQQIASSNTNQQPPKSADKQNISQLQTAYSAHSTGTDARETKGNTSENLSPKENLPGPFYIASVQESPPSTYHQGSNIQRQNTLLGSLPISLNPSLLINKDAKLIESTSSQKYPNLQKSPSFINKDVIPQAPKLSKGESQIRPVAVSQLSQEKSSEASSHLVEQGLQGPHYNVPKAIYTRPKNKDYCLRCGKKVYPMERTGPIKDVVYHKTCFSCVTCGTLLTLKNFHHNPNDVEDLSVFCVSHKPKERTSSCDANSVHIKSALTVPKLDKVNDQIRADRYPSEVLNRSGNLQPVVSTFSPARENLYYGMKAEEDTGTEQARFSYRHQGQQDLQQDKEFHHYRQQQQESRTRFQAQHYQEHQQEQNKQEPKFETYKELLKQEFPEQPIHRQKEHAVETQKDEQERLIHEHQEQQLKQEQEQVSDHLQKQQLPSPQYYQDQYKQLIEKNMKLQQQIYQNEENILNDLANSTMSEEKEIKADISNLTDTPELRNTQANNQTQIVSSTSFDEPDGKHPVSTLSSSSLSSSVIHQEISAEESISHYIEAHFKFDNHEALSKQRQELYNTSGGHKFINRELSMQSSRSTSPMQIQIDSRSTDDNASRRSSFSSNLSSRESIDLGASASVISESQQVPLNSAQQQTQASYGHQQIGLNYEHQQVPLHSGAQEIQTRHGHQLNQEPQQVIPFTVGRADRPSSSQCTVSYDMPMEKNLSARMIDRTKVDYNIDIPNPNRDMDRFLPKNEQKRMDRPSQYS